MKIVFLGLTITSSWGNGHATTYRSLCHALADRGHEIVFVEKDVSWYRGSRDLPRPGFCRLVLYEQWQEVSRAVLDLAREAYAVVIGSYFPDAIHAADLLFHADLAPVLFYDIDTPVTVAALRAEGRAEYLEARQIPHYRAYMSFTGGPILRELEDSFGSPFATPLYCSVDPASHQRTAVDPEFRCDLSYLGTYAADRQPKLTALFCDTAEKLPQARFVLAGPMYPESISWPDNVWRFPHVPPPRHPAFYSSSRFTLNLTRADMVAAGWSPSVRLFEAAACGAAMVSDSWPGLDEFFTPGEEILLPANAEEVAAILTTLPEEQIRVIGEAARRRVLQKHTAAHRAQEFEAVVERVARPVVRETARI